MTKEKDAFDKDPSLKKVTEKRNKTIVAVDLMDLPIEGISKTAQIVAVAAHFQKKINEVKKEENE